MEGRKHRAVFLDRDGTICEEVGYLDSIERFRLIPRSAAAIRLLNDRDFKTVVITNQAGIGRGYFPESTLKDLHAEMIRQLEKAGAHLDGIYFCPHHPTEGIGPYLLDCDCRKPGTGLLKKAAVDLSLDLSSAYMIGDHFSDIECGQRVGAKTVLVLTGHGREALANRQDWLRPPSHTAEDLYEAILWVIRNEDPS